MVVQNCNNGRDDWSLSNQYLCWDEFGFTGNFSSSNYALFNSYFGVLSPTEVAFVLMHALSEDAAAIFQYTEGVFHGFHWRPVDLRSRPVEYQNFMNDWKQRLASVSYQSLRPQPRFEVGTEVFCLVRCSQFDDFSPDQDQWCLGVVEEHWYRQPWDGRVAPYRVKLQPPYPMRGLVQEASILTDLDTDIVRRP